MYPTVVTGGSGLVGKTLQKIMPEATYLSSSDYDLRNEGDVGKMFYDLKPVCIIHLAAKVGGIADNIAHPAQYFEDNVIMNTLLLKYAVYCKVPKFIGMLSSCIYPDVGEKYPMDESQLHLGPPTPTNLSYAYAKRAMAVHIDAVNQEYGHNYQYLSPCNLYGEYDKYDESNSHFVAALIKKIRYATHEIEMWGTGKPCRQFMYAGDLAKVIKNVIDENIQGNYNVAPPWVHTIDEIAHIAINACGKPHLKIRYDASKPDGQLRKDIDSSKLLNLLKDGFKFTSLEDGIKKTYDYFSQRHNRQ